MKLAPVLGTALGLGAAVTLHAGFLLFGKLLFPGEDADHATLQQVDLLSEDVEEPEKEEEETEEQQEPADELQAEEEEIPDAAEIVRNLEQSANMSAPALEAASLSAIEAALSGQASGGGDFAEALSFSSGGRIGGMGKAGDSLDEKLEQAFSLSEIDQRPRAVFQSAPAYPSEMRGKKVEGVVSVILVVDAAGKVTSARVEKTNHPAFSQPALDAVRQWKFEPAVKGGQRVSCKIRAPIRFPTD